MKITDILKKVSKGEELSEAEKTFLDEYKEPEDRIPKSRLDEEISKRKKAEETQQELTEQLDTLKAKVDELETQGLSEAEKEKKELKDQMSKIQKDLDKITQEKESASSELEKLKFSQSVSELANGKEFRFKNTRYLEHLIKDKELDLSDKDAVQGFMKELQESEPDLFVSVSSDGGGGSPASGGGGGDRTEKYEKAKESGDVADMIGNAPTLED